MSRVESFPPVIGNKPRVLILGSMPGAESLRQQRYYAHPRNAFWSILGELLKVEWDQDYNSRILQLKQYPLVLWDVLQSCIRPGSLDTSIQKDSVMANDIAGLLQQYADIQCIAFNGGAAEQLFKRHVKPSLKDSARYRWMRMPSTSPAHASQSPAEKLQQWQKLLPCLEINSG